MAPPSPEERMQILKMLQEGRITAEEANELLNALEASSAPEPLRSSHRARFFRIVVEEGNATKMNVQIPLGLIRVLTNIIPRDALRVGQGDDEHVLDLDAIIRAVEEGAEGKIVEVEDDDTRVEIFVD